MANFDVVQRLQNGDVSRDEFLARLRFAILFTAAVAFVLGQHLLSLASESVATYSPVVLRTLGDLLERAANSLKDNNNV